MLPTLAGLARRKKHAEFRQTLSQGLSYLAFANLIASAIALALAVPIVAAPFRARQIRPRRHPARGPLAGLPGAGTPDVSMNNIFARAFYALNDIQTPMKISILCLFLNLGFPCGWCSLTRKPAWAWPTR